MSSFFKGFAYAGKGVWRALCTERNMRFHLCAAFYVFWLSRYYTLTTAEHAILAVVVFGVFSLELINTSVEKLVDIAKPEWNEKAGTVKDIAAGAVLAFCVGAVIVGIYIFGNTDILMGVFRHFAKNPFLIVLFILSVIFCLWFIFGLGRKKGE